MKASNIVSSSDALEVIKTSYGESSKTRVGSGYLEKLKTKLT